MCLDLVQDVKQAVEKTNEAGNERKSLENKLSSVHEKLRNLYGSKPQFYGSLEPLLASVVEKHILENKVKLFCYVFFSTSNYNLVNFFVSL